MNLSRLVFAVLGALVVSSVLLSSAGAWVEDQWAQAKPLTVKAGSTTEITWKGNFDHQFCSSSGVPTFSTDQQGTLGSFSAEVRPITVRPEGSQGAGQCAGMKIQVIYVLYKAGAKPGTERVSFVLNNMGFATRYVYNLTVK